MNTYCELKNQQKEISFVWVKAHVNISGNEIVDKLAKEATFNEAIENSIYIPHTDIFRLAKEKLTVQWQKMFDQDNKSLYYKWSLPKIWKSPWFYKEYNRPFVRVMSRIRCNHALYPLHQHKIGLKENEFCLCGEKGDMNHHILGCINHIRHVNKLYQSLQNKIDFPFNVRTLIISNSIEVYKILYCYILDCKIKL